MGREGRNEEGEAGRGEHEVREEWNAGRDRNEGGEAGN